MPQSIRRKPLRYYEVKFQLVVQAKSADDALSVAELSIGDMDWDRSTICMDTRKASLTPEQIEWAKKRNAATSERRGRAA